MRNRFKRRLYKIQEIKRVDGHLRYVTNDDGTLFAGPYRTKIKPEDLPEWYLYTRTSQSKCKRMPQKRWAISWMPLHILQRLPETVKLTAGH